MKRVAGSNPLELVSALLSKILRQSVELTWELWSDSELNAYKDDPLGAPIGDNFNNLIKSTCRIVYFFPSSDSTRNSLS